MDLLSLIILWGFAGMLVVGILIGIYYTEFKHHCKQNKSFQENKQSKFHGDFRMIDGETGYFKDSRFIFDYNYCQTYYCLQCGIISHWNEGIMTIDDYCNFIKDNPKKNKIINKINQFIEIGNEKYKLNKKLIIL